MKKTLTVEKFKTIYMSLPYIILTTVISFFNNPTVAQDIPQCELPQFGVVYVNPDIQVNGAGQNVDTIEFWKAPDSTETLMFVTAKNNHLVEVWKYPFEGNELTPLRHSTFNSGQVNGVVVDQQADLLYVAIGSSSSTVSVFSLPDLNFVMNFNKSGANYQSEPNLTLLNLSNGNKNVYVSADYTVYIHDAVTGDYIDEFVPTRGLETMAADSYYQRLYIPDENGRTGIYVYKPDGSTYTENGGSYVFGTSQFNSDAEGIVVYNCPLNNPVDQGNGFIVVSDQRSSQTDFEFFDRITWEHLGTLRIGGVSNTHIPIHYRIIL
jgi:WD40 repeat protein